MCCLVEHFVVKPGVHQGGLPSGSYVIRFFPFRYVYFMADMYFNPDLTHSQ